MTGIKVKFGQINNIASERDISYPLLSVISLLELLTLPYCDPSCCPQAHRLLHLAYSKFIIDGD